MEKIKGPRWVAINTIERIQKGGDLQAVLDHFLCVHTINIKDKALITHLTYGYFRLKARLEFILRFKIRGRFKKLPKRFVLSLALATYEILYLDRVPEHATLNWYVEFVKTGINKGLTGLANGVLRNICREKTDLLHEDYFKDHTRTRTEFLSVYYSIPVEILSLLISQYGEQDGLYFLKKSISAPFIGIRLNLREKGGQDLQQQIIFQEQYDINVGNRLFGFKNSPKGLDLSSMEQQGLISRKSVESQKILLDLECEKWEVPIWDMCAGFGGKVGFLVEYGKYPVWASDIDFNRVMGMKREKKRLGLRAFPIFLADGTAALPLKKVPNTILLDVPCSGLGVLSRRPDIKWKMNFCQINLLKKIQYNMLQNASDFLNPGGKIAYITCTWNREENNNQVMKILKEKRGTLDIEKEVDLDFKTKYREFFYGVLLKKRY